MTRAILFDAPGPPGPAGKPGPVGPVGPVGPQGPAGTGTAGITQLTGDVTAGPGSGSQASSIYGVAHLNAVTLEKYGAVGDGTTDDSAAMTAAIAAIASGGTILLGAGKTYLVGASAPYTLPTNSSIIGQGRGSALKTASNTTVLVTGGQNITLRDFRVFGNSTGSSQFGIANGTIGVPSSGFRQFYAVNVSVETMGGDGWIIAWTESAAGVSTGNAPIITGCEALTCAGNGFNVEVAEYIQFTNCTAWSCGTGLRVATGNLAWSGGQINDNTNGVLLDNQGNALHGTISATLINHNGTAITSANSPAVASGFIFSACFILFGDIYLINTESVHFVGCTIDVGDLIFQGSTNTRFESCLWPMASANAVFHSYLGNASTEFFSGDNLVVPGGTPFTGAAGHPVVGPEYLMFADTVNIGTNKAGATLALQAGDARTFLSSTANGAGTAATTLSGSLAYTTRTVTASFTVDTTTTDNIILVDTSAGAVTVTLPTPTNGRILRIVQKNGTWSSLNLTIARHGSEKINGASGNYVSNGTTSGGGGIGWITLISDGTDWYVSYGENG